MEPEIDGDGKDRAARGTELSAMKKKPKQTISEGQLRKKHFMDV